MKRCPRCEKTFPDSETFCEADGTALVNAGPAFAEGAGDAGGQIECPVCGGKAQPGELICNFCGARLGAEAPPPSYPRQPSAAPSRAASPGGATTVQRGPSPSMRITGGMAGSEDRGGGGWRLGVVWYLIAAIVALGGGAWFALHLSSESAQPVANASPSAVASVAAPAPTGPLVALAKAMGVQVTGESAAAAERNQEAARKGFEDHKDGLLESYSHALAGDSTLQDAMVVRIRVLPAGNVDEASVRTSTNANPAFDAEIVKDLSAWNFARFSGGQVEVDYPIIFTNDPASRDALESQLSSKLAGLSPTEAPEFASAPPSSAASEAASLPSPAAVATPPAPMVAEPVPSAAPSPRRHRHVASAPKPPPLTLQQRVKLVLGSNPRTRRVDCYTSGSTVTIFGKVFDADAKRYTEKLVRQVPGVGNVIDSLTTDESDWAARQAAIASQLYAAGLNSVTVKVIGHDAYLGGTVKTDAQKRQAVTIAESASPGVRVETNLITIVPGNMFGF